MFGTILISICTIMHLYVFWRVSSVPLVKRHVSGKGLIIAGIILWAVFFLGRVIGHHGTTVPAVVLEFAGMTWMAVLFLTFIPLLAIDIFTLFGFIFPRLSPSLRGWALLTGILLSIIALFQGLRAPVMEKYEVYLPGLPKSLDGTVLIAMSDTHVGSQLGRHWLSARVAQVKKEKPDLVILLGDIFEGHESPSEELIRTFKQISAPLGLWAVPGNHEFHRGEATDLFKKAGFKLLRNQWEEVCKGLVLAGVDGLASRYRRGDSTDNITKALNGHPPGAAILLSHTPWQAERAAKAGAGLMLSGHTHGGQIWPFDYLVKSRYPLLEGRYEVEGMTVIVSRGTGTWGPRMRLWSPGEILYVTLRAGENRSMSVK